MARNDFIGKVKIDVTLWVEALSRFNGRLNMHEHMAGGREKADRRKKLQVRISRSTSTQGEWLGMICRATIFVSSEPKFGARFVSEHGRKREEGNSKES